MSFLKSVEFSVLELASLKDTESSPSGALQRALRTAKKVEQLGFKRFWVAEHHNMDAVASSATTVFMGYLAAGTERIRIGSGGIMLPNHAPLVIAEQIGTLATLYPERIDLGLGRAPGTDGLTARALRRHLDTDASSFPDDIAELQMLLGPRQEGQRIIAMPGVNTNVPIWILGSSLFSAQLAAARGLPYSFASHFAPGLMMQAIELYRAQFQPSATLDKPKVMLGVPLVVAETDERAEFLATTTYLRVLSLLRGQIRCLRPPVDNIQEIWNRQEEQGVSNFLSMAIIGSPTTVKEKLKTLLHHTQADELIFTCDLYDIEDRLRSFELLSQIKNGV